MTKITRKITLKHVHLLAVDDYVKGILKGDRTILSRAITLIESSKQEHHEIAEEVIEKCLPHSGKSIRIGITGVPGVGKSTFIEAFGSYLVTSKNKKVAVLAIDPSSRKSGGSILGDKTRMNKLAIESNAFVRPTPSSGALGGVAKATRETIILCEAAGFDTIIVETVGVGQSETEVKSMVDFFLLLMLAGAGDELQGIKRGIMEMADAIAINKADDNNIDKAKLAQREYKNALHLFPHNTNNWTPKVEICSAINSTGIDTIWGVIEDYISLTSNNGYFDIQRKEQAKFWLDQTINSAIQILFYGNKEISHKKDELEKQVINGVISPFKAAKELLTFFKK